MIAPALAAFVALAAPAAVPAPAQPESPRWAPAPYAPELDAARALLRPLYALRGALFQLRAERLGGDPDIASLSPVDAGVFATRLAHPKRDLERGAGLRQVVYAADAAAATSAARQRLKAAFRRLAADPRFRPDAPLTPGGAKPDAARLAELTKLVDLAARDLEEAAKQVKPAAAKLLPVAKLLASTVSRVKPTDPLARAGLHVMPESAAAMVLPLHEDAAAAPDVVQAIAAELAALGLPKTTAARLPAPDFAEALAIGRDVPGLPNPPVPLDPGAVCRVLWEASCARLTTCRGAIENVVMSPAVCEEGADALIEACLSRSPNGYAEGSVTHAALKGCVEAWANRPCEAICGKAMAPPDACDPFDPGAPRIPVACGEVRDEPPESNE